ncbi:centrosomal protein of 55 kDa-like isoform X3 [Oncorhynchus keta]|uniref:centrosomal protein of 55 kDa-like isoform X3 n=1 Tax=Oncorhynchus keta TaxID=8018 RepID=UPI00227AD320|nr:centrosomal protein of 55 kDa-like isoform X3 [Oncorhynchus keta]
MASKGTKETIVNKLGFKSSGSKQAEAEMDRLRKENAHLKQKMDELSKRTTRPPDSDKSKLLERILSLETLRERNTQQLLAKDKELETLRQHLHSNGGEVVASLQAQLDQGRREAEYREKLFQSLSEETGNLKNKLVGVSARCQALEKQGPDLQNGQGLTGEVAVVEDHLRDALEKNQQWLVYDQQREAYVKGVLARTLEMEQQLNQANKALQQHKGSLDAPETSSSQLQEHYDKLLLQAKQDVEAQKEAVARAQGELGELQRRYEERCMELVEVREQLRSERLSSRHTVGEERKCSADRADRMRSELDSMDSRLEEERKRSAELLLQIQLSAKDFENEKLDRQSLQHQLHKVLKELRKARDQIARLESSNQKQQSESRFSEPSSYKPEFERLSIEDPTSTSKNLLDESFLECPKCRAPYATSQHRELLAHLDYCFT